MKHVLLMLVMLTTFSIVSLKAQVFSEGFEATVGMTSSSTGIGAWGINSRLFTEGSKSDSVTVTQGDTTYLTVTTSFSTVGKYAVYLNFDHICKIELYDNAYIEVSNNNGTTWTRLQGVDYLGTGQFGTIGNRFCEASYSAIWGAGPTTPEQSWWQSETFDLSTIAANAADVTIRFVVADGNNTGAAGRNGWFLDNIVVTASVSELVPPSITLNSPIIQDTVYTNTPINISASISDASGIDTAICIIHVMPEDYMDTVAMVYDPTTVDTFNCAIPFYGFGRTTNYYVKAWDGSFSHNNDSTATFHYIAKNSPGGNALVGDPASTGSSSHPFYTFYHDARSQYLFTAAEINAGGGYAGPITSIALNVKTINTSAMSGFAIKIKNTTSSTMTAYDEGGYTTVFSPVSYAVPAIGWQTLTFTTPFIWNGSSNIIIEFCFDNTTYTTSSTVQATTATAMGWARNADGQTGCSMTGGYVQNNRPNTQFTITGSSELTNDMGVASIVNPNSGVLIGNNFDIKVDLANYGIDTITSAQVNWSFDGVAQTPYIFGTPADSIFPTSLSDTIILGTKIGTAGTHNIVAWTILPNGSFDTDLMNDTAKYSFYGCASLLAGSYTIGGTGADFATFTDAVLALNQCGISAPVVFNVSNGVYNEHIIINDVAGSSATNTIIFQSTALDSSTTILSYDAIGASDNYVVKLNGTNNIIFKNLSFVALDSTYARVFELTNNAYNLAFNNNIFSTVPSTEDDDNMALILATDTLGNNINISNNALLNSALAIRLQGGDINATNWNISNNIINGHFVKAIELIGSYSANVMNNQIYADTSSQVVGYVGILLSNSSGIPMITKNRISTSKTKTAYGIVITDCVFDTINYALIANNIVNLSVNSISSTLSAGVLNYGSSNVNIYNNSLHFEGNQENSANIILYDNIAGTSMNINIVNNNLTNNADGYLFYVNNVDTSLWTVNNNNLYKFAGSNAFAHIGATINNFTSYVTKSGAVNSTNYDPYFSNTTGIHINNNLLNNTGIVLATVTDDINGVVRNVNTPDISAYEFDAQPWDIIAIEVLAPMGGCGLSTTESVTVRYRNVGTSDITTFNAYYQMTGNATIVNETVTTTIDAGDTLDYTFNATVDLDVITYGADSIFEIKAWGVLTGDLVQMNDTTFGTVNSGYIPANIYIPNDTINYGQTSTLYAITGNNVYWWASAIDTVSLIIDTVFTTPNLYDTTTYWVNDGPNNEVKITETVQYKTAPGATSPYPTYLPTGDFDGVEITNLGGKMDLAGYTINVSFNSTVYTYTFPLNTSLEPGDVALAIYGSGLTVGPTGNNVFVINPSTPIQSSYAVAYWLTSNSGEVVDAFSAFNAPFPANSGVTASDFTGASPSGSGKPGSVRMISDNNDASDWSLITAGLASFGSLNPQLSVTSAGGCFGVRQPVTIIVENIPPIDASISAITSPMDTVIGKTDLDLIVDIKNYGTSTLTSLDITYSLNTINQDTIHWTGSIAYQNSISVVIDTINVLGGLYELKVWSFNPNNISDTINSNDTAYSTFAAQLHGNYTIGVAPSFDYPDFTTAANALIYGGVAGACIFNIDTGTFTGQVSIPEIYGVSATNNIIFQSMSGDSTTTILDNNSTITTENYVIKLDGADYFTFQNLTIKSSGSGNYQGVIEIGNESTHNNFYNNIIQSSQSTSSYARCIYSNGANDNYTQIINNHIKDGNYAVYMKGATSSITNNEEGTIINDNLIEGFSYYGIYAYYQDSIIIKGNTIINGNNSSYNYPMYVYYCNEGFDISNNILNLSPSSNSYGLRIYNSVGNANERGLVSNNMISITSGTGINYGLYLYNSQFVDVYHNSVNITGGGPNSRAAHISASNVASDVNFVNNILRDSIGYTLYLQSSAGISQMDYNSHYSTSVDMAYDGSDKANLAALQASSGKESHSVFGEQMFNSNTDLHLSSTNLSGYATPISLVTEDIDGKLRNTISPTIGAHETDLVPIDMATQEILLVPNTTNEFTLYPVMAVIRNNGTDTIFGYQVNYTINGGTSVVNAFTDNLAPYTIDTVSLTPFISPAGASIICITGVTTGDGNIYNNDVCHNFVGIPLKDAQLLSINPIDDGCTLTTDTVVVWIKNIGIDTINASGQTGLITLSYVPDFAGTVVTENFTSVLNPGDSIAYEFNSLIDFTNSSQYDSLYTITAWVDFAGDNVDYNDTVFTDVLSMHIPYLPVVVSPVSTPYGTQTTLVATSVDLPQWYKSNTSSTLLGDGNNFLTPYLYLNDTFNVSAISGGSGGNTIIGTGTENNTSLPLEMYYGYTYSQSLYTPSDFTDISGKITSISYYYNGNSSYSGDAIDIYMGTTNKSQFSTSSDWVNYNNLTLVFSGTLNTTTTAGWITFVLDVPFIYDGNDNLVVGFDENTQGYHSNSDEFLGTQMSNNRSIYNRSDNTNPNPMNPTNGTTTAYIPNTMFELIPSGCISARVPVYITVGAQNSTDVGITRLVDPVDGFYQTSSEDVSVTVKNYGINSQSNIPVNYIIDGGTTISEVVPGPIASGDTLVYTFSQTFDFSAADTFSIIAFTSLTGDATALNDTTKEDVINGFPIYCISKALYTSYAEMTGISIGNNWSHTDTLADKVYSDYTDFTPAIIGPGVNYPLTISGEALSTYTGNVWVHVYIDFNRDGVFDELTELAFADGFTPTGIMSGVLAIPFYAESGLTTMRVVMKRDGNSGNTTACGTYSYGETEDYRINVMDPIPNDAGVEMFVGLSNLTSASSLPITTRIRNYGSDPITSVDISYYNDVNSITTFTYNAATIAPGDSVDVLLGTLLIADGMNEICAFTTLAGDTNTFNDSLCYNVFREAVVNLTYCDDFEGTDLWMPDTLLNQWERGIPTMTNINMAHSPTNVWAIDLDGTYQNNRSQLLYSPKFVITNIDSAMLKFWHYYDNESGSDGGYIQYSKNDGAWVALGYVSDPRATNWYNDGTGGTNKFSGNSNAWVESTYNFDFTTGEFNNTDILQIRFNFYSNASGNSGDGWAIDDLCFELPLMPNDVGVVAVTNPISTAQIGSPITVTVDIANFGSATQTSFDVWYQIGNDPIVTATFAPTGGLASFDTLSYTFTVPGIAHSTNFIVCTGTSLASDIYPQNDDDCSDLIQVTAANIDGGITATGKIQDWGGIGETSYLSPVVVKAEITNFGVTTLTSFDIEYSIDNGNNWTNEPWTGSLASNEVDTFIFATTYNSPPGNYSLCIRTVVPNDAYIGNDQKCDSYIGTGINDANGIIFEVAQNEPNPAVGNVRINYIVPTNGDVNFELRNTLGQMIYSVEKASFTGKNIIEIDADKLANGVYYYSVIFDGQRITRKMIVNQ